VQDKKAAYTWNPIELKRQPHLIDGDSFNIIQHPDGEPKKFALRGWKMKEQKDQKDQKDSKDKNNFIQYNTDTMPGSSGAPVFNDFWELVAVHHSSETDENDSTKSANQGTHVRDLIDWLCNTVEPSCNEQQKVMLQCLKLSASSAS